MQGRRIIRALGALATAQFLVVGAACSDGTTTAPPAVATVAAPAVTQADVLPNDVDVAAPTCWYFHLRAYPPSPNPATIGAVVRHRIDLINLGTDGKLYGAAVQSEVLQGTRVVYSRVDYQPSSPNRGRLVWIVPYVPPGVYLVRTRAISGLAGCGATPFTSYTLEVR